MQDRRPLRKSLRALTCLSLGEGGQAGREGALHHGQNGQHQSEGGERFGGEREAGRVADVHCFADEPDRGRGGDEGRVGEEYE